MSHFYFWQLNCTQQKWRKVHIDRVSTRARSKLYFQLTRPAQFCFFFLWIFPSHFSINMAALFLTATSIHNPRAPPSHKYIHILLDKKKSAVFPNLEKMARSFSNVKTVSSFVGNQISASLARFVIRFNQKRRFYEKTHLNWNIID